MLCRYETPMLQIRLETRLFDSLMTLKFPELMEHVSFFHMPDFCSCIQFKVLCKITVGKIICIKITLMAFDH